MRPKALSRKAVVALCILLLYLSPSKAAPASVSNSLNLHQWGAVTLFHGLPSDHVRAIAQDAEGMLWFGTDGGLTKYDGRRIQKVAGSGLPTGRIHALRIDRDGILWVGTDAGAARLVQDRFIPVAETSGQTITAIVTPQSGRVLLASAQGRFFTCTRRTDGSVQVETLGAEQSPLLRLPANAPLPLTSLAVTAEHVVAGTRGRGLLGISGGKVEELLGRPRPFFINHIETDAAGHIWFGAETTAGDSGLYDAKDLLHPLKVGALTGAVNSLAFDTGGDLWVGTGGQGVFRYRASQEIGHFNFENTAGSLRSDFIYTVFVDREGVVWFGTDRGVCRYDPRSPRTETVSNLPESNFVRVLFQSADGRLWSGTNRGLFLKNTPLAEWMPVAAEIGGRAIYAIAEDPTGRLLIGADGGFFVGSEASFTRVAGPLNISADSVRAVTEFQGAIYLASYGSGLERFDAEGRTAIWPVEPADPKQREVVSLMADGDERLWIGTADAGLFVFDGVRTTREDSLAELNGSPVWQIIKGSDGALWLATGRGLYVYRSGKLEPILPANDVRRIVLNDSTKTVWCATSGNGLFKILFDKPGRVQTRLNTEHGLPSNNIFSLLATRSSAGADVLLLSTNRGITEYEPGTVAPVLRATRILGQRAFLPEQPPALLNLEYPQNSLLLEVAAVGSRTFPEQFQYAFHLVDAGGKTIGQRVSGESQFIMENLQPGRYRVSARAFSNDLIASDPLLLAFNVESAPFPWTSAALSILLSLSLVVLWYGYRQNRELVGANRALADTRRQLANETESERRRIARDLHDQTLSDLRRLLLLTDKLPPDSAVGPTVFRSEIESISTEIRHICEDLSPSVLANVGLPAALEWAIADAVAHLPADRKLEYTFTCDEDVEERMKLDGAVQIQIYRILQEAISNICRHAQASRILLSIATGPGYVLFTLEDDGRGFDWTKKRGEAGRGLSNIRSRASLIEAEVQWLPRTGGGSMFTLRIATSQVDV